MQYRLGWFGVLRLWLVVDLVGCVGGMVCGVFVELFALWVFARSALWCQLLVAFVCVGRGCALCV